jgi:hypothetical protein
MAESHAVEARQVGRTLGRRDDVVRRHRQVDVGHVHFDRGRAERLEDCDRLPDPRTTVGVKTFVEVLPDDADLEALNRIAEFGDVIGHGLVQAGRIALVEARHDAKHSCGVFRGSRNHAGLVEARGERDHAVARYAAVGRLDADRTGQRRGLTNRATRIRPGGGGHEAGRHGGCRTARRAAGRTLEIPRVPDRAEIARLVRGAHRELVHVGFAEHDGAGAGQALDDGRIIGRDEVVEYS